ncbi:MAG: TRAP transporter small permease [Bacillota bacterium]
MKTGRLPELLKKVGSVFTKVMEFVTDIMAALSGVCIILIMLIVSLSVLLRYYFQLSVGWTTEMAEYLVFIAVMLGVPWVLRNDGHVKLDVLVGLLDAKLQRKIDLFNNFLGIVIGITLFYYGSYMVYDSYINHTKFVRILPIPRWLLLQFIPLSCFVFTYQFCAKVWRALKFKEEDIKKDMTDKPITF